MKKLIIVYLVFTGILISQTETDTLYYLPYSAEFYAEEMPIAAEYFNQHVNFYPAWENYKINGVQYLLTTTTVGDTIYSIDFYKDSLSRLLYSEVINKVIDSSMVYPNWFGVKISENAPLLSGEIEMPLYFEFCHAKECYESGNSIGYFEGGLQWRRLCDPPIKLIIEKVVTGIGEQFQNYSFALLQNYPNPFNPVTNLEFRIADFGLVTLTIYDILGNEVSTLVNEEKPSGSYKVKFNGSGLTSGIYFYTLISGSRKQTNKLVLLK